MPPILGKARKGSYSYLAFKTLFWRYPMRKTTLIVLLLCALLVPLSAQAVRLRMAMTTSTLDSGLLTVLDPPFEKLIGLTVDVIAVGSGEPIKLGENEAFAKIAAAEAGFVSRGDASGTNAKVLDILGRAGLSSKGR